MSSRTREIVSLQFGEFANKVAAHFWNLETANAHSIETSESEDYDTDDRFVDDPSASNPYRSGKTSTLVSPLKVPTSRRTDESAKREMESLRCVTMDRIKQMSGRNALLKPGICLRQVDTSRSSALFGALSTGLFPATAVEWVPRTVVLCANGEMGDALTFSKTATTSALKRATVRMSDSKLIGGTVDDTRGSGVSMAAWSGQTSTYRQFGDSRTYAKSHVSSSSRKSSRRKTLDSIPEEKKCDAMDHKKMADGRTEDSASEFQRAPCRRRKLKDVGSHWSQWLECNLDSRSIVPVSAIHYGVSSFDTWAIGSDLLSAESSAAIGGGLTDQWLDAVRRQVEDCDWAQGFQLFGGGMHDSWAALSPSLTTALRDDFGTAKCVLLYDCSKGVRDDYGVNGQLLTDSLGADLCKSALARISRRKRVNHCIALSHLYDVCTQIVPLNWDSFGSANWREHLATHRANDGTVVSLTGANSAFADWIKSAAMATAIHQCHAPTRLKSTSISVAQWSAYSMPIPSHRVAFLNCNSTSALLDCDADFNAVKDLSSLFAPPIESEAKKKAVAVAKRRGATDALRFAHPMFEPWLRCVSPIESDKFPDAIVSHWKPGDIFGESTTLVGTSLFENSADGGSADGALDARMRRIGDGGAFEPLKAARTHSRKFAMRNVSADFKAQCGGKQLWHSSYAPWRLRVVERDSSEETAESDAVLSVDYDTYASWTSLWSGRIIGDTYLRDSAQVIGEVLRDGSQTKLCGDSSQELDLSQIREQLLVCAHSYTPDEVL